MALLVWRWGEHFDHFENLPCVLCRRSTPLRSHADEAVHKVCAELWISRYPDSKRFYSDPQPKKSRSRTTALSSPTEPSEGGGWNGETLFDLA
jgi:hypothetical protein